MMRHRLHKLSRLAFAAGLAGLSAQPASTTPACDPGTVTARADRTASYLPFHAHAETMNVRLEGSSRSACRIALRLSSPTDGVLQKNGEILQAEIRTREGRVLVPDTGDPFQITLLPAGAAGVSADLIASIPPRQSVSPGLYQAAFELEWVSGEGGAQRAGFSLAVQVAAQADVRLAGNVGGHNGQGVDFGRLESGREETVFVSVRSNGAYAIELQSRNGWFLELAGASAPDARIGYSTWFNDYLVPPQTAVSIPERYEPTGQTGQLSRLRFRIGDVRGKPAGLYQDTVSLTVILLE